jgi:hypothetical protein
LLLEERPDGSSVPLGRGGLKGGRGGEGEGGAKPSPHYKLTAQSFR